MITTPAITLHQLTKCYQQTVVVDCISLEIAPGSIYSFLGPNCAGKTITIRMLLGLVLPTSGTAQFAALS